MKNYVHAGNVISLTAPYDLKSGDGLKVGSLFGIASSDAAQGYPVEAALTGVYNLAKVSAQGWIIGTKVYWDDTARKATATAADNILIGAAIQTAGIPSTTGRVRLNGIAA